MIRVADDGPVRVITLARAEKRNALTPEMLAEVTRVVKEAPASTRVIVLAGEGSVFCAGFDLALCAAHPDGSVMRALLSGLSALIISLRDFPGCVVVAAQGGAIAGGCAMLGGADVVVTDRGAKFGYPVLRIGVSPAVSAPFLGVGAGFGPARARMLDTGLIDAERARAVGLVHEVVDGPGGVLARAMEVAKGLAEKPPTAIATTKGWLNEIEDGLRGVTPERGLAVSMGLTGGDEEREGLMRAVRR
ncbi:MAG: enoyl-CoA hydratase/isomerase family protein [Phycisphaerales bacterium]|nr:enoyl-CoA hydratase/isomerase family protein [Phycisphaerales bacterium]